MIKQIISLSIIFSILGILSGCSHNSDLSIKKIGFYDEFNNNTGWNYYLVKDNKEGIMFFASDQGNSGSIVKSGNKYSFVRNDGVINGEYFKIFHKDKKTDLKKILESKFLTSTGINNKQDCEIASPKGDIIDFHIQTTANYENGEYKKLGIEEGGIPSIDNCQSEYGNRRGLNGFKSINDTTYIYMELGQWDGRWFKGVQTLSSEYDN